jgi:hypothetical protein
MVIAEDAVHPQRRFLVLANLAEEAADIGLELSFPEGAPVLETEARLAGSRAKVNTSLPGFGVVAQPLSVYLVVEDGNSVRASALPGNRFQISPPQDATANLTLRYRGPALSAIRLEDSHGTVVGTVPVSDATSEQGARVTVAGQVTTLVCIPATGNHR